MVLVRRKTQEGIRMTRKVVCLAVLATLGIGLAFVSGRLSARADDAAAGDRSAATLTGDCPVAVIDVGSIFDNCEPFKARLAKMKEEIARTRQEFAAEARQIMALEEQLENLDQQSGEYRVLQEQVESRRTVHTERAKRFNKGLMIIEAEAYAAAYIELQDAVEKYAKAHGIRLVIRCNTKPMDPNVPLSVMKRVNRDIVFQDGIDITAEIIRRLNNKRVS